MRIKLIVLAVVVISLLVLFAGSMPILAESPNPVVPTVVLPTPVAKPTVGAVSPAKVPTRALVAPTTQVTGRSVNAVRESATNAAWSSSITYYTSSNTASASGMLVTYYAGSTTYSATRPLGPHQAGSLYIGDTTISPAIPSGFNGSAVLSSDVSVVATSVFFAQTGTFGLPLYSGFASSDAGSKFYIPTVLRKASGSTSRIGVQNTGTSPITPALKFYAVGATTPTTTLNPTINGGASYVFSAASVAGLSDGFSGSLVIDATSGGGSVVASAIETFDAGPQAYAFNGSAAGANNFYMPSAMCNAYSDQETSYFAIQNTSTTAASVVVNYYNTTGTLVKATTPRNIVAGGKLSVNPCGDGVASGYFGSATIAATGAQVIAIGKIWSNISGMATAYEGLANGALKVAAPYIRWANVSTAEKRAWIAIMNVGAGNATNIVARYYNATGALSGTHNVATGSNPLPRLTKRNTNPQMAGALDGSGNFGITPFGGAVEITSDQPIVVVVRLSQDVTGVPGFTSIAEDYDATVVP